MKTVDIHSHILPNIDDGAKDMETSVKLLEMMHNQGITDVFATPHFLPMQMSLDDFLENRKISYEALTEVTKGMNIPKIHLGGEIFYFPGIGKCDELSKLKLMGTKYILIELSNEPITNFILKDLADIYNIWGLIPIIAHIERYYKEKGFKQLIAFIKENECIAQLNANSLISRPFVRVAKKLIKKDIISFIATDSHSVDSRPPKLDAALNALKGMFGNTVYNSFINRMDEFVDSIKPE